MKLLVVSELMKTLGMENRMKCPGSDDDFDPNINHKCENMTHLLVIFINSQTVIIPNEESFNLCVRMHMRE